MKRIFFLLAFTGVALFLAAQNRPSAWMQVYQRVEQPPDVRTPPDGWEDARVPSGRHFPFYAYESFTDERDWITGRVTGRRLVWKRASFFLPAQDFGLMQLMPDNSWRCIAVIPGPRLYIALDAMDGDGKVFRLEAL